MISETEAIRIVQYGLGPIGAECVRTLLGQTGPRRVELVGAIDIDTDKAGRDLGEVVGVDRVTGVEVSSDAAQVIRSTAPQVVLHTTSSFLDRVYDQLELCVRGGANVVSSTEELLFPFKRHPDLSSKLDRLARDHGVTVLGTGVNPGYVMDNLALMATGVCREVRGLDVERVVDASSRRLPLQRKIGAGLSAREFEDRKQRGAIGHIGLRESLLLVAYGLGWELQEEDERLDPVLAEVDVRTPHLSVRAGQVAGIHHTASGRVRDGRTISLDLKMYVGAREPRDAIRVDGDPPIDLVIRGGVFGDTATVAALVNAIPAVGNAAAGLTTVIDIPAPRAGALRITNGSRRPLADG